MGTSFFVSNTEETGGREVISRVVISATFGEISRPSTSLHLDSSRMGTSVKEEKEKSVIKDNISILVHLTAQRHLQNLIYHLIKITYLQTIILNMNIRVS